MNGLSSGLIPRSASCARFAVGQRNHLHFSGESNGYLSRNAVSGCHQRWIRNMSVPGGYTWN
jgi:hypothetical protein